MRGQENRIEKLEDVCRPPAQRCAYLVMLDENGEPINEYYADELRLVREAKARGEDVYLTVLHMPAGFKATEIKSG